MGRGSQETAHCMSPRPRSPSPKALRGAAAGEAGEMGGGRHVTEPRVKLGQEGRAPAPRTDERRGRSVGLVTIKLSDGPRPQSGMAPWLPRGAEAFPPPITAVRAAPVCRLSGPFSPDPHLLKLSLPSVPKCKNEQQSHPSPSLADLRALLPSSPSLPAPRPPL